MHKVKNWLTNLANGILQNLLANILLVVGASLLAGIYAFYKANLQTALLVTFIILTAFNTLTILVLLRRQAGIASSLKELLPLREFFPPVGDYNPLARQAEDEFEITDKHFDGSATPQKLVVRFTNRGNNVIRVRKVKFSDRKIPAAAILPTYRKESDGRYLIPFDQSKSEVAPGQDFLVEIGLSQIWQREDVDRLAGEWGYLRLEVEYKDSVVEIFKSI